MTLTKIFHKEFEKIRDLVTSSSFGEKTIDGIPTIRLSFPLGLPESDLNKILYFQKSIDNDQVEIIISFEEKPLLDMTNHPIELVLGIKPETLPKIHKEILELSNDSVSLTILQEGKLQDYFNKIQE